MKARNPSTGNLETVYVKALDSMPVGTQVEFSGDTIPTGWEEINDYSTDEVNTGKKWIDGKPIYRKVIECGSLPNNSGKQVLHNIANLNFFTNAKIWGVRSDKTTIFYPYYDVATPANSVTTYLDATQIYLVTKSDRSSYTAYALLEYTKTTD